MNERGLKESGLLRNEPACRPLPLVVAYVITCNNTITVVSSILRIVLMSHAGGRFNYIWNTTIKIAAFELHDCIFSFS